MSRQVRLRAYQETPYGVQQNIKNQAQYLFLNQAQYLFLKIDQGSENSPDLIVIYYCPIKFGAAQCDVKNYVEVKSFTE